MSPGRRGHTTNDNYMALYFIGTCLLAGFLMLIVGLFQAQADAPERAAAKLTRLKARREVKKPESADELSEIEFVRQEEKRARTQNQQRKTTFLPSLSNLVSSNLLLARMEEDLVQTRSSWRASELVTASVFLGLLIFIFFAVTGMLYLGLIFAPACLFFPWGYVKMVRARYYRRFDEQLAETLLLMANSLKAGFSFLQSMEMVAREAPSPICDEFQRVTQEITIGISVNEALNNLSARVNSMDLQLMVIAVLIQREVGSSLAEILEMIASVIRDRVTIRGEIRVLTTQGRFTGFLLGLLPVGLGLMLHITSKVTMPNDPSFVEPLIFTKFGQGLLGVALVMELIGFIAIFRIVSIKV